MNCIIRIILFFCFVLYSGWLPAQSQSPHLQIIESNDQTIAYLKEKLHQCIVLKKVDSKDVNI